MGYIIRDNHIRGAVADFLREKVKFGSHLSGPLPCLDESIGVETFFCDERYPSPRSRRVFSFHRPETLGALAAEPSTPRTALRLAKNNMSARRDKTLQKQKRLAPKAKLKKRGKLSI